MQQATQADDGLVMRLLEEALARPKDERQAYLRAECAGDSKLFDQVCKYLDWQERMGDFLLEPLFAPPDEEQPFQPGEILIHRFRIVREVARGGMGIVWEAFDEKLDRRVAIKFAKAGFGGQLSPEVRHARDVSHPNVCKIFEIHTGTTTQGEVDFIVMEFVEGETLSARLQREPLAKKERLRCRPPAVRRCFRSPPQPCHSRRSKEQQRYPDDRTGWLGPPRHHGFRLGTETECCRPPCSGRTSDRDTGVHGTRVVEGREALGNIRYLCPWRGAVGNCFRADARRSRCDIGHIGLGRTSGLETAAGIRQMGLHCRSLS